MARKIYDLLGITAEITHVRIDLPERNLHIFSLNRALPSRQIAVIARDRRDRA